MLVAYLIWERVKKGSDEQPKQVQRSKTVPPILQPAPCVDNRELIREQTAILKQIADNGRTQIEKTERVGDKVEDLAREFALIQGEMRGRRDTGT